MKTMTTEEFRKDERRCECGGKLDVNLKSVSTKIKRSKEELMEKIDSEVAELMKKVGEGDLATIQDLFGQEVNPHLRKE